MWAKNVLQPVPWAKVMIHYYCESFSTIVAKKPLADIPHCEILPWAVTVLFHIAKSSEFCAIYQVVTL